MVADLWGKYVELVGQVTNEETGETMSDGYVAMRANRVARQECDRG